MHRHKRCRFHSWFRRTPWRRAWQPTLVSLPGESPWTEEPGGLQSMGLQRVRQHWNDLAHTGSLGRASLMLGTHTFWSAEQRKFLSFDTRQSEKRQKLPQWTSFLPASPDWSVNDFWEQSKPVDEFSLWNSRTGKWFWDFENLQRSQPVKSIDHFSSCQS